MVIRWRRQVGCDRRFASHCNAIGDGSAGFEETGRELTRMARIKTKPREQKQEKRATDLHGLHKSE